MCAFVLVTEDFDVLHLCIHGLILLELKHYFDLLDACGLTISAIYVSKIKGIKCKGRGSSSSREREDGKGRMNAAKFPNNTVCTDPGNSCPQPILNFVSAVVDQSLS